MAELESEASSVAPLTPEERESFLAAIARHRRACWRVTAACTAAVVALALVVAILMAPLLYSILGLALDVANLFTPAPDLMTWIGHQVDAVVSAKQVSARMVVRLGIIAALPGLALMAAASIALGRVWRRSPLFDGGDVPGRPADRSVFEEARLANIVEEMAIAAGIAAPRVIVVPGAANAAACGRDSSHVTLLVGELLLTSVNREQLAGMIAHRIGSIANGDMAIGLRVTTTVAMFGLVARVGGMFSDRHTFRETARLWRVFFAPTSSNTAALIGALADPFDDPSPAEHDSPEPSRAGNSLTWREWLQMPLIGPMWLTGFFSGFVTQLLLEPLIAVAWRQRIYMADAVAVQLTRDPDGLAGALAAASPGSRRIAPWLAHLAVAADGGGGPFGRSIVPIFPSPERRVAALRKMGAHVALQARKRIPWPITVVLAVIGLVVAGLLCVVVYLLVMVSTALSGLFTIMPAMVLHLLLRWMGH